VKRKQTKTALMTCALVLAGCSAPQPPRYYTLLATFDGENTTMQAKGDAVQVLPVLLPEELDTTQLLVRTGPGEVVPLNGERWAGHLSEQIRGALSDRLSSRLNLPAVLSDTSATGASLWRVQLEVQRFESTPQGQAGLEAVWRIQHPERSTPLCRSRMQRQSDSGDVAGLVLAHQANIDALAVEMVAVTRSGRCPD